MAVCDTECERPVRQLSAAHRRTTRQGRPVPWTFTAGVLVRLLRQRWVRNCRGKATKYPNLRRRSFTAACGGAARRGAAKIRWRNYLHGLLTRIYKVEAFTHPLVIFLTAEWMFQCFERTWCFHLHGEWIWFSWMSKCLWRKEWSVVWDSCERLPCSWNIPLSSQLLQRLPEPCSEPWRWRQFFPTKRLNIQPHIGSTTKRTTETSMHKLFHKCYVFLEWILFKISEPYRAVNKLYFS